MPTQMVDGLPVRLRAPHDLSFLSRWGTVFRVFDEQDSGNLCFGIQGDAGRLFVKYAGAPTLRYEGAILDAVERNRAAADVYRALAHPSLVHLREAVRIGTGHALVFDWTDAVSVGWQHGTGEVRVAPSVGLRARAVQQVYDFHAFAAERGWVAVDLYDGTLMLEPVTGVITLCDLDFYRRGAFRNDMGRMWGSSRFMSPEELRRGDRIDEVTNVFALGAIAHTLLGDDATKSRDRWVGTEAQWQVASRALCADRSERWPSVRALADAWRQALA